MSGSDWRYAFASVRGTSHDRTGVPCQDASACSVIPSADGESILVAVVSDGAGSATRSDDGARRACEMFTEAISAHVLHGGSVCDINREHAHRWLADFQHCIREGAERDGLVPRDFACTVLVAVIGIEHAVFFQMGDGAIVVSDQAEPNEYTWVFWPKRGEYANTTYFATDSDASDHLDFALVNGCIAEVALFTDGIESLALHYETQTAHGPFFRPIFAAVRLTPPGLSHHLSGALATFLDSARVNARSDDDKTLAVATRRPARSEPAVSDQGRPDSDDDDDL